MCSGGGIRSGGRPYAMTASTTPGISTTSSAFLVNGAVPAAIQE
jgi:hypothetical protein